MKTINAIQSEGAWAITVSETTVVATKEEVFQVIKKNGLKIKKEYEDKEQRIKVIDAE